MSNSEIAFDKLTCLIEDTNTLLINEFTFGTDDFEVLKEKINIYFDKYEYKPNIVKGITSTIPHKELLKSKLNHLKTLLNHCNYMIDKLVIPNVIMTNEDVIIFTKHSILENRIKPLLEFVINEIELTTTEEKIEPNQIEDGIDFSDTSGTEKIIMLYKLGVLDFLKTKHPFNTSTNKLASAISGITGIRQETTQLFINPIDNPNTNQKNNPLETSSTVKKVEAKLLSIGFNQPK